MLVLIYKMRYFFCIIILTTFMTSSLQAEKAAVKVGIADISGRPSDRLVIPVQISGLEGREIVSDEVKYTFDLMVSTYL